MTWTGGAQAREQRVRPLIAEAPKLPGCTAHGDDLEQTTDRAVYRDCRIGEIRVGKGTAFIEPRVPGGECFLREGEAWGDLDGAAVEREMIRRTIREHVDKEKRLRPQGIKVLSLFFIDAVERYRRHDDEGNAVKGGFACLFEEEYRRLAWHPHYQSLFREVDLTAAAEAVHDGIECGKAHFHALEVRENPARYEVAASVDPLLANVAS